LRLLLLFSALLPLLLSAQERFPRWNTDIRLNQDRSIDVVETITVVAEGDRVKRGITRTLVNRKNQRTRISSVDRDDRVTPYHTETNGSDMTIYIGSRDEFLEPGTYTYRIAYTLEEAVTALDDLDELYFNVFGDRVEFPIEEVRVALELPEGVVPFQYACYTGGRGRRNRDCTVSRPENGSMTFETTGAVPAGQPFSVAAGFEPGYFSFREPERLPSLPLRYGTLIILLLTSVAGWQYAYSSWKTYGVDPPAPDLPPAPYPPAGYSPAEIGLLQGGFVADKVKLFTASLMDLGRKNFLRITSEPGILSSSDYRLEKLADHPKVEDLPLEQQLIFEQLFRKSDTVILSGRHNQRIEKVCTKHYQSLYGQHKNFLHEGHNLGKSLPLIGMFLVGGLMAYALSSHDPYGYALPALVVYGILALIALIVYVVVIGQPSVEKVRLLAEIQSLHDYLDLPEKKRSVLPDAPPMNPEYYERMLPYAIALGIHTKWTEYFEGIAAYEDYQPTYILGPQVSIGTFQRGFQKSVSATATTPASSSSGSSGSGGGGFSGGGSSGGGGAGGW
jgi:uncharacterized membrane protein